MCYSDLCDAMFDASLAQKILHSEEGFMVAPPSRRKNNFLKMFHLFPEPPKCSRCIYIYSMNQGVGIWEEDRKKC